MSSVYGVPLEIKLVHSRYQRLFEYGLYSLAVVAVLILPFSLLLRTFLIVLLLIIQYLLNLQRIKINRINWYQGDHWELHGSDGQYTAQLLSDSVYTYLLVILNFKIINSSRHSLVSVVVWSDSVHPEIFRRLMVRLRIDGVHKS